MSEEHTTDTSNSGTNGEPTRPLPSFPTYRPLGAQQPAQTNTGNAAAVAGQPTQPITYGYPGAQQAPASAQTPGQEAGGNPLQAGAQQATPAWQSTSNTETSAHSAVDAQGTLGMGDGGAGATAGTGAAFGANTAAAAQHAGTQQAGTATADAPFTGFVRNPDGTFTPVNGPYGYGAPYVATKQKRRWSTAALAAAAALGMVVGGLLGTTAGSTLAERDAASSSQSADSGSGSSQWDGSGSSQSEGSGTSPWGQGYGSGTSNGSSSSIQSGTKVSSAPGVVLIESKLYNGEGAGTGIVVNKSGIVVTNYHVVEGSTTVTVTTADGSKSYSATVIGHNEAKDVAVLKISDAPSDLETVTIASTAAQLGDTVYAEGNGSGQGYITKLEGKITAVDQSITASDSADTSNTNDLTGLLETDADVVPGYSGGPLLNADGEVVGINTAASTGNTSEEVNGYAIPIASVMDIADSILNGDTSNGNVIGRNAALGITVTTVGISGQPGSQSQTAGVQVEGVTSGSGADKAGIVQGNIITALNGQEVTSASDLADSIRAMAIGDTVTLTVTTTDGTTKQIKVTLGEATVN